ncbi:LysR family transcriptional regulator (plasmid) [Salipiger sp. H15]|uniref:LysR family transcriptional regulator n=1 Tax=Alloyangia sp. H15 TaxID=3029062 RepID=A0AAU8AQ71_9RHOB
MDSRQLRYFVAVCDFRNLSHAADHCHVAASAISQHVAALEAELGTPLFTRRPRGMEPTAAGLTLETHARAILAAFETAAEDVRTGQAEVSGAISIGMPFSVISVIGGPLMRRVMGEMPRVKLLLREVLSGVGFQAVQRGEIEAGLIFNPPVDSQTERIALLEEEVFCIGHPDILGASSDPIRLKDIAELPLAILQSGYLSRALNDRPAEFAFLEASARIQLASVAATLSAMKEGLACTLAPKVLVSEDLAAGRLVARPIRDPSPRRTLYWVVPLDARPTPLREIMFETIRGQITASVTEGRWLGAQLIPD